MFCEFVKFTDNTLTADSSKYEYGQVYEIPKYFQYSKIKINIYSYDNGWIPEKDMTLNKDSIDFNRLCIGFVEKDHKVILYSKTDPIYSLEHDFDSSATLYTVNEKLINYEETPLIMLIRFRPLTMEESKYKGYVNQYNERKIDFDKYQMDYPLIIEEPAKATLVTYQFVK